MELAIAQQLLRTRLRLMIRYLAVRQVLQIIIVNMVTPVLTTAKAYQTVKGGARITLSMEVVMLIPRAKKFQKCHLKINPKCHLKQKPHIRNPRILGYFANAFLINIG